MSTLPCGPAFTYASVRAPMARPMIFVAFANLCFERTLVLVLGLLALDLLMVWCGGGIFALFGDLLADLASTYAFGFLRGLIAYSDLILVALIAVPVAAIAVIHGHKADQPSA